MFFLKYIKRFFLESRRVFSFLFGLGLYPDYLIIGTQKGGTSSLQEYLLKHPKVLRPTIKEVHYFDNNFKKGLRWYRSFFPFIKKRGQVFGEASPYYIYHSLVPRRVKSVLPNIKIIVLLRSPAERAFSHYKMELRGGYEKESFEKALEREKGNIKNYDSLVRKGKKSFGHQHFSYLDRGKYSLQLKRWFKYFDRENFLIIKSEDLFINPQEEVSRVFSFLGLNDYKIKKFPKINRSKNREKQRGGIKDKLNYYFRDFNLDLCDLLGRNIDWD